MLICLETKSIKSNLSQNYSLLSSFAYYVYQMFQLFLTVCIIFFEVNIKFKTSRFSHDLYITFSVSIGRSVSVLFQVVLHLFSIHCYINDCQPSSIGKDNLLFSCFSPCHLLKLKGKKTPSFSIMYLQEVVKITRYFSFVL